MYYFISDSACIQLEVDIETESVVPEEHIQSAIKFGIESSDLTDVKTYSIAFLKRLLFLREKSDKGLLQTYLNQVITQLWQEVLSSLEERNRKLTKIESGSFVFTLFCPTDHSSLQLQDEKWRVEMGRRLDKLLNTLGISTLVLSCHKYFAKKKSVIKFRHYKNF